MIQFSGDFFVQHALTPGTILYFHNDSIIHSPLPHYHVIVKVTDKEIVLLASTTSRLENKIRYIAVKKLPMSTLVFINPDTDNGLTVESAVNCNEIFQYSKENLKTLYTSGDLKIKGQLQEAYLEQIIQGLIDSPLIEKEIKMQIKGI